MFQVFDVFFSLVSPATVAPITAGCDNNDDCPSHTACQNRLCINPCAYDDPCSANAFCKVLNHSPVCTCPDGYIGDPTVQCLLRKYQCHHILQKSNSIISYKIFSTKAWMYYWPRMPRPPCMYQRKVSESLLHHNLWSQCWMQGSEAQSSLYMQTRVWGRPLSHLWRT